MNDKNNFTESEENLARRREVSSKFVKMGKALIIEGKTKNDFCLLSAGNLLVLISGLVLNTKKMDEFNFISSLFTAKNIVDDMMESPFGNMMMGGGLLNRLDGMDEEDSIFGENMGDIKDILSFLTKDKKDGNGPEDFLEEDGDGDEDQED